MNIHSLVTTIIRRGDEMILSKAAGTLLRTKGVEFDEGGVFAGYAVLDSPFLY